MKTVVILSCTFDPLKENANSSQAMQKFLSNVNKELSMPGAWATWLQSSSTDFGALKVTLTAVVTKP